MKIGMTSDFLFINFENLKFDTSQTARNKYL